MTFQIWKTRRSVLLGIALLQPLAVPAQVLLVNRGSGAAQPEMGRVGRSSGLGFVADHFRVGAAGETWVIDAIQTWAAPNPGSGPDKFGDWFGHLSLFGGIESPIPKPGEPVCDCHNLMVVKAASWRPGADNPDTSDVQVSRSMREGWQVTFRNLSWSVPGGVDLQFGVMAEAREPSKGLASAWYNRIARDSGVHELKLFDEKGKLETLYTNNGAPLDPSIGISLKVWGHKPASISIQSSNETIGVVLHTTATLDSSQIDLGSLRFGPSAAAPVSTRLQGQTGHADLMMQFRRLETGIAATAVSACLDGRLRDGTPFQGCDLVKKTAK